MDDLEEEMLLFWACFLCGKLAEFGMYSTVFLMEAF